VTIAAGLAAASACEEVSGVRPGLKWPNDLVIERVDGTRKLAGLLAESVLRGDQLDAIAVGMGLNVQWPSDLPDDLASIATALNLEARCDVDRDAVLAAWLDHLDRRLDQEPTALMADYRDRCVTLGAQVRVELGGGVLEGRAAHIGEDGRLVVSTATGEVQVAAGDVVHLRSRA
jgi:BirA family biotin operon repressor/biotin-[acetyl-CoA-carboxylase] ligase